MTAIELYARRQPGLEERTAHAVDVLRRALAEHPGRLVQTTSLGIEGMVVTNLIARHGLPIPVATLDTGKLHDETQALVPRIAERYGLEVEVYRPAAEAVVHFVQRQGEDPMYRSVELRKACCSLRKKEPLQRLLQGRTAWITGRRRDQSDHRGDVPFVEQDHDGRTKYNPLADWSWPDIWQYAADHDVPYNPLHDQFMPSIGCAPCTRAIAVGEVFRAGRWWWEAAGTRECGLHEPAAVAPLPETEPAS
jgi:phosphoadenosine phosphosulfate reductase